LKLQLRTAMPVAGQINAPSHYDVLEVPRTATNSEIRRAYKLKALKHHPDKDTREGATSYFQRIQQAYEVLNSAQQRFLYDAGVCSLGADDDARNQAARQKAEEYRNLRRSVQQERLLQACKSGDTFQVMKLLRGCSASDINTADETGLTALMYAAQGRFTQVINLLVLYQADVNATSSEDWTPVMFSIAATEDASSLQALLKAKASPSTVTSTGLTPLLLATALGSLPMVQALLDGAVASDRAVLANGRRCEDAIDTNCGGETRATPLGIAASGGYLTIVEVLLHAGAYVDASDSCGRTPLMSASASGHKAVVEALLRAQADPRAKTADGCSALSAVDPASGETAAAESIINLLVNAKADTEASEDMRSAVQLAAEKIASEASCREHAMCAAGA